MINFDQNSIGRHHLVELMLYPMLQVVFELHIGGVARTLDESVPSRAHREADLSFGNSNSDALPALPIGLRGHVK